MKKEEIIKHCDDYNSDLELPYKIPHTYGVGLKFEDDGDNKGGYKLSIQNELPRRVNLEITSFLGSIGARHFYGKLISYSLSWETYDKNGKHIGTAGHGGYTPWMKTKEANGFNIRLLRPLTQIEIHTQKDRWGDVYKVGNMVDAFDKPSEIIELGKEIFKARFTGKWTLKINDGGWKDSDSATHRAVRKDFSIEED